MSTMLLKDEGMQDVHRYSHSDDIHLKYQQSVLNLRWKYLTSKALPLLILIKSHQVSLIDYCNFLKTVWIFARNSSTTESI